MNQTDACVAPTVFAWSVFIRGREEHAETVNARTRGQAKRCFFLDLDDCLPDLKFTELRAHKLGPARTSRDFARTAEYRRVPTWKAGDRVRCCGKHLGVLIGTNSSANFNVLFDEDDALFAGQVGNVHPHEIENLETR